MNDTRHRPDPAALPRAPAGHVMDLPAGTLRDAAGQPVPMRPRAWAVLQVLARHAGQVVTKDELLATVWAGLVVTDSSLAQAVRDARMALGAAGHQIIRTVPRRGYMLVPSALLQPAAVQPGAATAVDGKPSLTVDGGSVQALAADAQAHARHALTLDSTHPVAWRALAFSCLLQHDHVAALAGMRRSAELSPSNADSLQALCMVQFWSGQAEAALHSVESALALHACAPAWISFAHGAALWGVGRAREALLAMEPGRSEQPYHWTGRAIRMAALVETERIEEARRECAALLDETPLATAGRLVARFPDEAVGLRGRLARAAMAVGVPAR